MAWWPGSRTASPADQSAWDCGPTCRMCWWAAPAPPRELHRSPSSAASGKTARRSAELWWRVLWGGVAPIASSSASERPRSLWWTTGGAGGGAPQLLTGWPGDSRGGENARRLDCFYFYFVVCLIPIHILIFVVCLIPIHFPALKAHCVYVCNLNFIYLILFYFLFIVWFWFMFDIYVNAFFFRLYSLFHSGRGIANGN